MSDVGDLGDSSWGGSPTTRLILWTITGFWLLSLCYVTYVIVSIEAGGPRTAWDPR
jgi:hypothetical protein